MIQSTISSSSPPGRAELEKHGGLVLRNFDLFAGRSTGRCDVKFLIRSPRTTKYHLPHRQHMAEIQQIVWYNMEDLKFENHVEDWRLGIKDFDTLRKRSAEDGRLWGRTITFM
ncbi:hypothetical protein B0J14DRAFT_645605 [Halenospora varia]|nr:hypothetical protein B0J14DRAFT_645605 [Halenospora varia]